MRDAVTWACHNGRGQMEQKQENNTEKQRKHPHPRHLGLHSSGQKLRQKHPGNRKAASSKKAVSSHLGCWETSCDRQDSTAN